MITPQIEAEMRRRPSHCYEHADDSESFSIRQMNKCMRAATLAQYDFVSSMSWLWMVEGLTISEMDVLNSLVATWPRALATAVVTYYSGLAVYRLFFHPLAHFPGPKLAAISRWYEAYYDVVKDGQYTFKIKELHKKYGPIIRISPFELHVSDPDFYPEIYRQDGVWDKYAWAADAIVAPGATMFTPSHFTHRARRLPLNPFFSRAKISSSSSQDLLRRHLDKLVYQISRHISEKSGRINVGAALNAFTRDVANDVIIERECDSLSRDGFDFEASMNPGPIWRLTKHVRWFNRALRALPNFVFQRIAGEGMRAFYRHLGETLTALQRLMAKAKEDPNASSENNIVQAILTSKLPDSDKTFERIFEDLSTIMGAGVETTAGVLRMMLFHTYTSPTILSHLRSELATIPSLTTDVSLKALEKLPYLTAVLHEGLRLSPAVATRMSRIAPDRDLFYQNLRIPAGTPVGMTTLLMHTDEDVFPDPMRFDPGRWLEGGEMKKTMPNGFAPFGRGTRVCVGMHLAWAELYLVTATLVRGSDFDFEGTTAEDLRAVSDQFIIGTKHGGNLNAVASVC
ncbi:cytochrome P450, partial [Xylariaceae sp. FL1272]